LRDLIVLVLLEPELPELLVLLLLLIELEPELRL
jgi:hypothetical protein